MAILLCVLSVAPVLFAAAIGAGFLTHSISQELRTLMREELEEARLQTVHGGDVLPRFAAIARDLANDHPEVSMAWRLRTGPQAVATDFGPPLLTAELGAVDSRLRAAAAMDVVALGEGRYAMKGALTPALDATLLLDGSKRLSRTKQFWVVALLAVTACVLSSVVAARILVSRLGAMLSGLTTRLQAPADDAERSGGLPIELRPIVAELRRMLEQVTSRARQTQCFVAGLAHELRSPIQNLIGQAEVAQLRSRSAPEYRELLESQLDELHEFARAVDNLLLLCAVDEPTRALELEDFDCGEEVALRLHRERRRAAASGIEVAVNADHPVRVHGDREAVMSAIRNLVDNAIKWAPRGSRVEIAIRQHDGEVVVDVDDAGPGIPKEERARLFQPFVRGRTRGDQRAGFGLGLAIARVAAERCGGSAQILDAPGGGTRARLVLRKSP
jgi:signal transduction histidine kinase